MNELIKKDLKILFKVFCVLLALVLVSAFFFVVADLYLAAEHKTTEELYYSKLYEYAKKESISSSEYVKTGSEHAAPIGTYVISGFFEQEETKANFKFSKIVKNFCNFVGMNSDGPMQWGKTDFNKRFI